MIKKKEIYQVYSLEEELKIVKKQTINHLLRDEQRVENGRILIRNY